MTDRRATDLSYGQVGEASYDIDEIQWTFSADHVGGHTFQQLLPFSLFEPPSFQTAPIPRVQPSNLSRSQAKHLVRTRPETFPANPFFAPLSRDAKEWQETPALSGGLFSVGGAIDVKRQPGYRTEPIIAIPHGEAGHVLRLIMPGSERQGWASKSSMGVSMMSAKALDYGYWVGTGGTIHQIIFADEGNVASTWLAVRQAFMTTIFRPTYDSIPQPAIVPVGYGQMYPPSRLSPNPVATLTIEKTNSKQHADVSFNPYYTRQFAVVDDVGSWSIWDIEGRVRNESSLELIPGKRGQIYDGYIHDPSLRDPNNADGWHRILWAGNVSTIIICNRRHISVFDLKSAPTRLQGSEILPASSTDWIRDVKRSSQNSSHVFILTSSRIFWLEVIPAAEDKEKHAGIKTLLSYRHFLDSNDDSLKLTVLRGTEVLVLVSSSKSPLIRLYSFSAASDDKKTPTAYHGAFTLEEGYNEQSLPGNESMQSLYFNQASVAMIRGLPRGPASDMDYLERNIKFFQAFLFSPSHGLKAALYSVQRAGSGPPISIPDTRKVLSARRYRTTEQTIDDAFIVPDGALDEPFSGIPGSSLVNLHNTSNSQLSAQEDPRLKLNWAPIFKHIFTRRSIDIVSGADSPNKIDTVASLLDQIFSHIRAGQENRTLPRTSLFELARSGGILEELEQVAPILDEFLETLKAHQDSDSTQDLILSDLTSCPGINFHTNESHLSLDLLRVYDRIGDHWLASLPLEVSNITRLTKFKAARKLAVEVCLSSVAVSLRDRSSHIEELVIDESGTNSLPVLTRGSRDATWGYGFSQITGSDSQEPASSLPTPARTPTLQSSKLAAPKEAVIDPAILRLRQYAISIAQPSSIGASTLLSLWPASPGADPSTYTWKAGHQPVNDGDAVERNKHKRRREESRRKKTERFLSGGIPLRLEASSQPAFPPFGSQPGIAHHASSSQIIDEQPMTQPDRGLFGSRSLQAKNKKPKKRRAAGF